MLRCASGMLLCLMPLGIAQDTTTSVILQFRDEREVAAKERILLGLEKRGPEAGEQLLNLAKTTNNLDTRWLAIRGLGALKFAPAAPFLIESLRSDERYVRANAARALGEIRYAGAATALIRVLEADQDAWVIEQTSLALRLIGVRDAVPVLKSRMSFPSMQTRCWLLDAIAALGSQQTELPFIATYLYEGNNLGGMPFCAAGAMKIMTKVDFGFPKFNGIGSVLFNPEVPVLAARSWWEAQSRDR